MRVSRLWVGVVLGHLVLGCGGPEAAGRSTAALVAQWRSDRPGAMAIVVEGSALEQRLWVEALLLAHPQDQREICGLVGAAGPAAEHCAQREHRPHLFGLTGGGPPRGVWPAVPPARESWPPATPLSPDCVEDLRCARDGVLAAAARGDAAAARRGCLDGWQAGIGRDECLFRAGETLAEERGLVGVSDALALCAEAGSVGGPCAAHVLDALVPEGEVGAVLATTSTVREVLPGAGGRENADFIWSLWTLQRQEDAPRPTAAGGAALPGVARPHLRMALAWALLAEEPPVGLDLGARAAELVALVAAAATRSPAPRHRPPVALPEAWPDLWRQVRPEEAALPRAWVLGGGTRTLGVTDEDDAKIALLEAGARLPVVAPVSFFAAGLAPDQPERVRWTAARLLAQVHPGHLPPLAADASALVRGRGSG